jgi:cytidyltransferase-like protein
MSGDAVTKLVTLEPLLETVRAWRAAGRIVVMADGVFDLLTVAHVRRLTAARAQGDHLVVAVLGDALASGDGAGRPLVGERDRALLVASLRSVDRVTIRAGDDGDRLVRALTDGAGVATVIVSVGCAAEDAAAEVLKARIRTRHAGA